MPIPTIVAPAPGPASNAAPPPEPAPAAKAAAAKPAAAPAKAAAPAAAAAAAPTVAPEPAAVVDIHEPPAEGWPTVVFILGEFSQRIFGDRPGEKYQSNEK